MQILSCTMFRGVRILQLIALIDMILAIGISCYLGHQIRQGAELIPGNMKESEKITRLIIYSALIYVFLGIQLYMAFTLMKTAKWVLEAPLKTLKRIGVWVDWSFVYLLFISLHGATALLLMKAGTRKTIILVLNIVQVLFRICAILITTRHQYIVLEPIIPPPVKV